MRPQEVLLMKRTLERQLPEDTLRALQLRDDAGMPYDLETVIFRLAQFAGNAYYRLGITGQLMTPGGIRMMPAAPIDPAVMTAWRPHRTDMVFPPAQAAVEREFLVAEQQQRERGWEEEAEVRQRFPRNEVLPPPDLLFDDVDDEMDEED